ncbi:hypothetical protein GCM10018952_75800 [Streptosporangium vulgare]
MTAGAATPAPGPGRSSGAGASAGTGGVSGAGSRERILSRIRSAVAGAPDVEITRAYRTSPPADPEGAVELLAERVADYRAVVHVVGEAEVAATIAAALARRGATRLVVPDGLPPEWVPDDPITDDPPLSAAELDGVDGVVTGCAVAIAETGTIVLDAGPGQGRRALTLVPDSPPVCRTGRADRDRCPRGRRQARPLQAADLDQRPLRDQRHRAEPGGGRARPAHAGGRHRPLSPSGVRPEPSRRCRPPGPGRARRRGSAPPDAEARRDVKARPDVEAGPGAEVRPHAEARPSVEVRSSAGPGRT